MLSILWVQSKIHSLILSARHSTWFGFNLIGYQTRMGGSGESVREALVGKCHGGISVCTQQQTFFPFPHQCFTTEVLHNLLTVHIRAITVATISSEITEIWGNYDAISAASGCSIFSAHICATSSVHHSRVTEYWSCNNYSWSYIPLR